jgi:hypothetical protein
MSYRMVVGGSAWRFAYCISPMPMPATSPVVQNVRRRPCGLTVRADRPGDTSGVRDPGKHPAGSGPVRSPRPEQRGVQADGRKDQFRHAATVVTARPLDEPLLPNINHAQPLILPQ